MVFSDTTNKDGIMQMIEQTTDIGDTGITGDTVNMAYFTNLTNQWAQICHFYAWTTAKNWHFDDSNFTDFPMARADLVDAQRDYCLPSALYRLKVAEVMDTSGNYRELTLLPEKSDVLFSKREQETGGLPTHYRMMGRSIKLYPVVDANFVTISDGLRLTYDREMDLFSVTDTTQEPGFDRILHPVCYYGPSMVWAGIKGLNNISGTCNRMLGQFPGIKEIAEKFYRVRDENDITRIVRRRVSYR